MINDATGELTYVPCGRWLDRKEDDGKIERELPAAVKKSAAEAAGAAKCTYRVLIHTSDIKFAGTDADVFVEIVGTRNGKPATTGRVKLDNSLNNFEQNDLDWFTRSLTNVGTIERICIGHDATGPGAAWHLDNVEVLDVLSGATYKFYWQQWLSREDKPHVTQCELYPLGTVTLPPTKYTITTYTSDLAGASTDALVSCIIIGDRGRTSMIDLAGGTPFRRAGRDDFVVKATDIGVPQQLYIGHDNTCAPRPLARRAPPLPACPPPFSSCPAALPHPPRSLSCAR